MKKGEGILTRKWAGYAVIIYLLYIASMYGYLFFFADTSIPDALKGTAADPQTFLNARELVLSEEYSTIRNFIFFLNTPLEWLIYFFILIFGISRGFEKWSLSISRWKFVQTGIYLFWLSLLTYVAVFPIQYVSYTLSRSYHINTQTFSAWMKDEVISFLGEFRLDGFDCHCIILGNEKKYEKMVAVCMASVCSIFIASHVCTTCSH